MTALLKVELTRLRWRRAVLLLLVAAFVVPMLILAARVWDTRPPSADDIAEAKQAGRDEIALCEERPSRYGLPRGAAERCEKQVVGWYIDDTPLRLGAERPVGAAVTVILTLLMVLLGTTFAGHDWSSGSMSNQLLFEPRRGRVWLAKGLVLVTVAFAASAAVLAGFWSLLALVARSRDLPVPGQLLQDVAEMGLRGAALAAAAALGGYALTMLFRSTVATLGVVFAVSVLGGLVIAVLGIGERWQPQVNVAAWLNNGTTYYVEPPRSCFTGREVPDRPECRDPGRELSGVQGAAYFGFLLVAACVPSVLSHRRRDIP